MPETAERTSADIRTELVAAATRLRELRSLPEERRPDTHSADLRAVVDSMHELDTEFTVTQRLEADAMQRSAWEHAIANPPRPESNGPRAAFDETTSMRTPGEQFTASDAYEAGRGQYGARYYEHTVRGNLASAEFRALITGGSLTITVGDDGGVLRPLGQPIAPVTRQQRLFVRDVLNVIPTTLGAVPYIRELNALTNETAASAVAEGAAKPEATMEFELIIAPVVKIAAWVPVTSEIIEDAPLLEGYINTRLSYMLALREEAQILKGPGTGANMTGIMETAGTQTQADDTDGVPATVGQAIGKIENVDGEASFVAINPVKFWDAVTTRRTAQFDHGFGGDAPSTLANITWGLPAIRTRVLTTTEGLVGARMGATIADRMDTTIRVGNQHSTFFTENKVAILAEERVALLVHRPDLFVECTFTTS
jgi:HK97 family phage major capsid protein